MRLRMTLLSVFAVMATLPSAAPARTTVTPKAGNYFGPSVLPGGRVFPPGEVGLSFIVLAGGTSIKAHAQVLAIPCGTNAFIDKKVPIRNGSFTFTGRGPVVHGGSGSITWTGKWSSATSVSGTAQVKTATCDSGLIRWRAKWHAP